MQSLYFVTRSAHSSWALFEFEKSIHSSRLAFSSVQTQHGYEKSAILVEYLAKTPYLGFCRRVGRGFEACAHTSSGRRRNWRCHSISLFSSQTSSATHLIVLNPL